jgi:hypothetical protein
MKHYCCPDDNNEKNIENNCDIMNIIVTVITELCSIYSESKTQLPVQPLHFCNSSTHVGFAADMGWATSVTGNAAKDGAAQNLPLVLPAAAAGADGDSSVPNGDEENTGGSKALILFTLVRHGKHMPVEKIRDENYRLEILHTGPVLLEA